MPELILASTSPWRRKMLADAGLAVRGEAPGVEEVVQPGLGAAEVAMGLAVQKAEAVARRHPGAWVLGADQVALSGGEIQGKPRSPEDHLARLQAMRGCWHDLVTGWALLGPGVRHISCHTTRLRVREDLGDDELVAYVATGEGSGCAGGYAIEGHGVWLFDRIEGDWFNILGLPLLDVLDVLRGHGWRYGGMP